MAQVARTGRRCDLGCETWPDDDEYKRCPKCGEPTKRYSRVDPLSREEARSMRLHIDFDLYYEHEHIPDLRPLTAQECEDLGVPGPVVAGAPS